MNATIVHRTVKAAIAAVTASGLTLCAHAQIDPDPDIFDANKNGAGTGGANISVNTSLGSPPLGGMVSVVDESALPPLGTISIDESAAGGSGRQGRGGPQMSVSTSSSSSGGLNIPIGGSGGQMSQQGQQSSPFPPMGQSSQGQMPSSQSQQGMPPIMQGQQQSGPQMGQQGQMPQGQQSGQQGQQGQQSGQQGQQSGQMPRQQSGSQQDGLSGDQQSQGQMQQGQQGQQGQQAGQGGPLSGQLPPPPPDQPIGDPSQQIDPNGELTAASEEEGEGGEGAAGSEGSSQQDGKRGGKRDSASAEAGQQQNAGESDNQEMPGDMGGRSSIKRGKGEVEDVAVPSNL